MIQVPYTLFSRIPIYYDESGSVFADDLWRKDLELHFDYIKYFRICCPLLPLSMAPHGASVIRGLELSQVIALRKDGGWLSVVNNVIPNFLKVAAALQETSIAHSGGAGWAFPISFYILPLRFFFRFKWVVVIESSFWMKPKNKRASLRQWISHYIHYNLLGAALRKADARIFTQSGYQRLFGIEDQRSLINPATWVDENRILSPEARQKHLLALPADEIRLLFPARMTPDKGPEVVMHAIEILDNMTGGETPKILIDLIGEGPLADKCRAFAESRAGAIEVRFLEAVPYGNVFFNLLSGYHAIILANLQDEQPRIVFDSFSQGVPVISSETTGVCDITLPYENALLFKVNEASDLAKRIIQFSTDRKLQTNLMYGACAASLGKTHREMHRHRSEFLTRVLGK